MTDSNLIEVEILKSVCLDFAGQWIIASSIHKLLFNWIKDSLTHIYIFVPDEIKATDYKNRIVIIGSKLHNAFLPIISPSIVQSWFRVCVLKCKSGYEAIFCRYVYYT